MSAAMTVAAVTGAGGARPLPSPFLAATSDLVVAGGLPMGATASK